MMMNEGKLNVNAPLMSMRRSICTPTEAKIKILEKSLSDIVNKVDFERGLKDDKLQNLQEGDEDEDDDDDAFSDALETLSSTESLCVSGLDSLDANKCRTSSTDDKKSQEFMMNRFLPAAKARTLQTHQHVPRKPSVLLQQPSTKLVSEEKKPLVKNGNVTDIIPYTGQRKEEEQDEEESDHDETDENANISAKGCGLFPSSYIKNSLCLLNSTQGTKMENQIPLWPSCEFEKPNKSSYYRSVPTIKKAWDAIHKSKSSSGASSQALPLEARKHWTSESNRYNTNSGELNQLSRLTSFRRSGAAATAISSFRSKPQSQAENTAISSFRSGHESFQEMKSQVTKRSPNSRNISMEKASCIDTASKVKLPCTNSVIKPERLITNQEITQESMSLQLVQSSFDKEINFNNKQIVVVDSSEKTDAKHVMHLLLPPLPKSPSDSWLCRALPLVSLQNSFAYSRRETQSRAVKRIGFSRTSSYSKWETIVKTSNSNHNDHECCSQELSIYKSQYSKS